MVQCWWNSTREKSSLRDKDGCRKIWHIQRKMPERKWKGHVTGTEDPIATKHQDGYMFSVVPESFTSCTLFTNKGLVFGKWGMGLRMGLLP